MRSHGRTVGAVSRWAARPVLAACVRGVVLLVPTLGGAAAGVAIGRGLNAAVGSLPALVAALVVSAAVAVGIDKAARRLLPLAMLLRLSLVFPDRVPSRFRVARQAGSARVLRERIRLARERGVASDPARAAEEILTLVAALSAHDRKTRGHSERVRAFTDVIAEELAMSDDDLDRLRWAALLHDIGKLSVPVSTLNKPGRPDEDEWMQLRRHPLEGERIAAALLPWLGSWNAVIGQHHERYDGGGYPRGLSADAIHIGARIVSVADSFEVMTAARSYKRPMTPTAARRELARCAGSQFDPTVVRALFSVSLGRLWWMVGPAAWVAQVPFMLGVGRAGSETVTAVRTAGELAWRGAAAVLAVTLSAAGVAGRPSTAPIAMSGPRAATATALATSTATSEGHGGAPSATEGDASGGSTGVGGTPSESGGSSSDPAGSAGGGSGGSTDAVSSTTDTVSDTTNTVGGAVGSTVDQTTSTVDSTVDQTTSTVSDVTNSTTDTVTDTTTDVTNTAGSLLGR